MSERNALALEEAATRTRIVLATLLALAASCIIAARAPANAAPGFPSGSTLGAMPDLTVTLNPPEGPGYVLAPSCVPDQTLITFLLRVVNVGSINSQPIDEPTAITVTSTDELWWTTGAPLGTIGAGQTQVVTLSLPAHAGLHGTLDFKVVVNGKPWFDEYSFDNNTMHITVALPAGFCPPIHPSTGHR